MKRNNKHRVVHVRWVDAYGDADQWTSRADLDTDDRIIDTIGILVDTNRSWYVTLALSVDTATDSFDCVIHIPHRCIIKWTEVDGLAAQKVDRQTRLDIA